LTLAEKILFAHLVDPENQKWERGKSYLMLRPDRVTLQDATAQMAILQFMLARRDEVAAPTTIHCDHLIRAHRGVSEDLDTALRENNEVYAFLRSAGERYGMGFWKPGAGIIHQVVIENYAFPGGMFIGTDSHTPNGGGLGMIAIGVGGADAVDVMVGQPWELLCPQLIGVRLTGSLGGWTASKDIILKVLDLLTVKGGTNAIVEYFGPGAESISCTGKATVTNMGAELGATTSLFAYDGQMGEYLRATERAGAADLADEHSAFLRADPEVYEEPERYYDRLVEIDLDQLEPHLVGPFTPDLAHPISRMADDAEREDYPLDLRYCLIGSCTNSSYEDMERAASVARQAAAANLKAKTGFMVTPGSDRIHETIKRDGQMEVLQSVGGVVLANACGPCIGQWRRDDIEKGARNSILTSFNRNFRGRNDANPATLAFIGSPELVTAMAFAGRLDFNPLTDGIPTEDGREFRFEPPTGERLPARGFQAGMGGFIAPPPLEERAAIEVQIREGSERLERLTPFKAWEGTDIEGLAVLLKASGKCTTDHISAAGPWLKYRGHLTNISQNLFLTANNAFTEDPGTGIDQLDEGSVVSLPALAARYRAAGQEWIAVGDENYGEGSSREHAAMEPRLQGARAVVVRSFARIHETNLKKQGVLPLTFKAPADYDKVRSDDRVALRSLKELAPGSEVSMELGHADGTVEWIPLAHTLNQEQIEWFRAGSALNLIRQW
ncbi:MAG: aconitate hydratase, partial [Deltaproteobacteria bacterium]|nr:aconitate hydratase [Deltaproteobacteria bacterium]